MKRFLSYTWGIVLAVSFLAVTSLSIVCAYHHGIDGSDQHPQGTSHSTLLCPSLSKVGGLALMIASGISGFSFDDPKGNIDQASPFFYSSFMQDHLARSPPSTISSYNHPS